MNSKSSLTLLLLLFISVSAYCKLKLPQLISDGMVLQRNAAVKIWGWATEGEEIAVEFMGTTHTTIANPAGEWQITLSNLTAGGPYTMLIRATDKLKKNAPSLDSITIDNILVGDVWVCSGQSNMEISMQRASPLYESEIANSKNPYIRYFEVPKQYNFNTPQNDISGGYWQAPNPENVLRFSAVAYFFALDLYQTYKVPIGLINSSLGGSPVEAWISEDALKQFPEHYEEAQRFKDSALINQIETQDRMRIGQWNRTLRQLDEGYKMPDKPWYSPELNTADWQTMTIPGYWSDTDAAIATGVVWFRKEIDVPASMTGKLAKLLVGRIVDADSVFVNGTFVGSTGYQYPPRRYEIPAGILQEGKNTITVRVINSSGKGGFVPDKSYEISVGGQTIDLTGEWQYKLGAAMPPLESQTFIRWKPVGLYNAMIAPLLNYSMKGVIWYQGESNAERPQEYRTLFSTMIENWREKWQAGDFPFLFVQLANFMEAKSQPSESNWALLREAQLQTLSLPNTGMAVTIDIGEWNDIHPLNKKDVGKRLALAAKKLAYRDEKIIYSGPLYQSMKIEGNKIILSFTHSGTGLMAKGDNQLQYFAIAGKDKQFVWANAKIEGDKVIVWNDAIPQPLAVRYAWADNPDGANLYNKEGLPASPFRTDDW